MRLHEEDQVLVTYTNTQLVTMPHDGRNTIKVGLFFRTVVCHAFTKIVSKWVKLRMHLDNIADIIANIIAETML
jgi:hypothetical protein